MTLSAFAQNSGRRNQTARLKLPGAIGHANTEQLPEVIDTAFTRWQARQLDRIAVGKARNAPIIQIRYRQTLQQCIRWQHCADGANESNKRNSSKQQ